MVEVKRMLRGAGFVRYVECPHCPHLFALLEGVAVSEAAAERRLRDGLKGHVRREHPDA
jgi:hypothetical protein